MGRATDEYGALEVSSVGTRARWWEVVFVDREGEARALVVLRDADGSIVESWSGWQVETKLARGYEGAVGGVTASLWLWIPLCLLFLAPFVDLRRPWRPLHLDLLALLAFGVSFAFFQAGRIGISVPLVYPLLAYLLARLCWIGFRGPPQGEGQLVPHVGPRLLAIGSLLLAALYSALVLAAGKVIDVGIASVIGADRLLDGQFVYGPGASSGLPVLGDVYGPVNYLAYVPFDLALPWSGAWDSVPAARVAALVFTLGTALCLYVLGRRLDSGSSSRVLGPALAFAWLAFPFTLLAAGSAFNDALVALLVVAALLVFASPPARGALAALAGLGKYGPLVLVPLFAAGTGDRRPVKVLSFLAALVVTAMLVTAPFLLNVTPGEIYDRSLGYQASRGSPLSIWGQAPSLGFLQTLVKLGAVVFGLALFFVPKSRSLVQVAALAAAALIAVELAASHWLYPYLLWILPGALVAMFAPYVGLSRPSGSR